MFTVHIEHPISDLETWKAAFDRDPADRAGSGVRRYVVRQPVDDPRYVHIDLDFDTVEAARSFLATMATVWTSSSAAPALGGKPVTAILSVVEAAELAPAPSAG